MAARRLTSEWSARALVVVLAVGLPLSALVPHWLADAHAVRVTALMPEAGGWQPANLTAVAGEPIHLRLTSNDVVHGFAIGQSDRPAVDVKPGEVTELTLVFDEPGTYTFYCTRWCGPNHWRMRGTIEVSGPESVPDPMTPPLYMRLGIDLDASRAVDVQVARVPSAARGAGSGVIVPSEYLAREYVVSHRPLEVWGALRDDPRTAGASAVELWNLVALVWRAGTTPEALNAGRRLYAANCAACHGKTGAGDGVMAAFLTDTASVAAGAALDPTFGHEIVAPADFTDPARMLNATSALLQGKIVRGGMGTGMPYWGPIFTEPETWALVDYLWSFQFRLEE
jgi:mono/diheme cytochrome c family protein/plastocyanin